MQVGAEAREWREGSATTAAAAAALLLPDALVTVQHCLQQGWLRWQQGAQLLPSERQGLLVEVVGEGGQGRAAPPSSQCCMQAL